MRSRVMTGFLLEDIRSVPVHMNGSDLAIRPPSRTDAKPWGHIGATMLQTTPDNLGQWGSASVPDQDPSPSRLPGPWIRRLSLTRKRPQGGKTAPPRTCARPPAAAVLGPARQNPRGSAATSLVSEAFRASIECRSWKDRSPKVHRAPSRVRAADYRQPARCARPGGPRTGSP
jgi:hypothetical protein